MNKKPMFSTIITSWNRANILPKAMNSVCDQTFEDWELIVIDDGSTDNTQEVLKRYKDRYGDKIKIITHEKCQERVISWNEGMKLASGDWISFLDSDDEYIFGYYEILEHNIKKYPEYKVFNFGYVLHSLSGATFKTPIELPDWQGEGMDHFDTGKVGAGSLVFKKECLEKSGYLPDAKDIYFLSNWFGERVEEWFAQNDPGREHQKYNQDDKWCGNPWGQDYVLAWLLTRKFKSKCLFIYPYIAYIRTEPWLYERAIISGTMLC